MNYRLTISYDGTRYHGWESKKEVDTIEGKLEAVFARMTEQDVKIHGAGRTDAGVHAMGMVANGFLDTTLTPEEIKAYANHYLPDDICIREVSGVSERFHARLNAKGKVYQYTCYIGDEKPVFERLYTWVLPEWVTNGTPDRMPDIEAMQKAAEYLIGTHDFKSFCGNNKMILTGTLLEVGYGRMHAEDMETVLASRDRQMAGPTAPPHGLMLLEVEYGV